MSAPSEARLIIICGLPGSGKTTLADALLAGMDAVRLSPDVWMDALGISLWDGQTRERIERLQWDLAQELLARGLVVIIEWGTWARWERDELREGARSLGAAVELRWLTEPVDVLWDRIRARGSESPAITRRQLEEWVGLIETPTTEELALYDVPL